MAQFTSDYIFKIRDRIKLLPKDYLKGYTINVEFNMPPLLDVVRYITEMSEDSANGLSMESKERVLKQAIMGKPVTILYRGKTLGTFTLNSMTDHLEAYEVLQKNPTALLLLMELAAMYMVGKSMPQPNESDPPAAAAGTPSASDGSPR